MIEIKIQKNNYAELCSSYVGLVNGRLYVIKYIIKTYENGFSFDNILKI